MLGKLRTQPGAAFGRVLRALRTERGVSQESLAFEAGLQRNYVSLIERGINQPTITTVFKLAHALNVTPARLVALTEQETER